MKDTTHAMMSSADVRARMIDALRLDLVGPRDARPEHSQHAEETISGAPSRYYLTGFLVPTGAPLPDRTDDDGDDELDQVSEGRGDDEDAPERTPARKAFFQSSMGLSVLVPSETTSLRATVTWGDYAPVLVEPEGGGPPTLPANPLESPWRRTPRRAEVELPIGGDGVSAATRLPDAGGLAVVTSVQAVADDVLPAGTRSVAVFLVNERPPVRGRGTRDTASAFQAELALASDAGFVPRRDARGRDRGDLDERIAELQYADAVEHAVGHAISAVAERDADGACRRVRTAWMPVADVEKVVPDGIPGVHLGMEALAEAPDAAAVQSMLRPMVTEYRNWIAKLPTSFPDAPHRDAVGADLVANARRASDRIEAGLAALADPMLLDAFRIANAAIARAIRQRACHDREDRTPDDADPPAWRPFQLAFILMNLPGLADREHVDRQVVDLLFFPTGGGKTEAYLGLAAVAMVLRRLRDPSVSSCGLSVLMRYTLRLLTLDQLGRAATLVCALELARQKDPEKLGTWPFEIGLWVGQAATPNRMGRVNDGSPQTARARTIAFRNDSKRKPSPIPLETCPWCGWKFDPDSFVLLGDQKAPTDLAVFCAQRKCLFGQRRKQPRGLPILSVDEPIYRRLPAFLIATVDKFASLPWVGTTAGLFGRVRRHDSEGFYGPADPGRGQQLPGPLPPPDLVIQDELHLISGPLGTMVGLYETAIEALCSEPPGSGSHRPKIVASTATVRRAERQIQGLFGRTMVDVFPPPGPDRRSSFFAKTVKPDEKNARTYLGIAAQGRNLKVVLLRSYLALLGAGEKAWLEAGGEKAGAKNPADPYMTLVGYFNALRELGGSRRIVEDEVRARLRAYERKGRRVGEAEGEGLFANRTLTEPSELTSRVPTNLVADTKRRLALSFHEKGRLDVVLATNMISVGLDVTRLGLMVVLGQPKTAAEYIQATSRVGRDESKPGLVVTLLNVHRPRDRSHYERFTAWHESFYRAVEATSVTPFSPRAVDRGLAGVVVALGRLGRSAMTPPRGASEAHAQRSELEFIADLVAKRAESHDRLDRVAAEELRKRMRDRVHDLLDAWARIAERKPEMQYAREVGGAGANLLWDPLDPALDEVPNDERKFTAHRSLRDVEPTVNLRLRNPDDQSVAGGRRRR